MHRRIASGERDFKSIMRDSRRDGIDSTNTMSERTAYPLSWPAGWPKTEPHNRGTPPFKKDLPTALKFLQRQIELMGGTKLVLSSNYTLGANKPKEPGVVAYFEWQKVPMAIPCDRWARIENNVQAIALTLEAMRGMERWGAKHMIQAMFTGFKALPAAASGENPLEVLGLNRNMTYGEDEIAAAYRRKALTEHPDKPGGSVEKFARLREAHDMAMQTARKAA